MSSKICSLSILNNSSSFAPELCTEEGSVLLPAEAEAPGVEALPEDGLTAGRTAEAGAWASDPFSEGPDPWAPEWAVPVPLAWDLARSETASAVGLPGVASAALVAAEVAGEDSAVKKRTREASAWEHRPTAIGTINHRMTRYVFSESQSALMIFLILGKFLIRSVFPI